MWQQEDDMIQEQPVETQINFKRGQIYVADLTGNCVGSEHNLEAPVLIIQNDIGNKNSPNLIVIPLSEKKVRKKYRTHVYITCKKYTGLRKDTAILCEQIRAISKQRITSGMLEQLEPEDMKKVEEAISCCLGMPYTLDEKQETFVESNVGTDEANKVQSHDIKQEKGNSKEINNLIKLLRESYLKEDKTKQKKILEFMLRNKDVYNKTIQQEHLFILVFLPYLYNWDHKVMSHLVVIETLLSHEKNKMLYKLYNMVCKERVAIEYSTISHPVRQYIEYNQHQIAHSDPVLKNKLLDTIREKSYLYFNQVYCRENVTLCPRHREKLNRLKVAIKLVNSQDYIIVEALYCEKCNRAYINNVDINFIHSQIRPLKLNIAYDEANIGTSTNTKAKSKTVESKNIELQQTSELSQLGYSVTKSKEERWRILQNMAIPKLGKKQVIKHLEWLIQYNKNHKHRERAIDEWKYDLRRLKS